MSPAPSACASPTTRRGGYTPWTGHHNVLRGEKRAGRPERGVSISPFNRSRAKRSRHCRTHRGVRSTVRAMAQLPNPRPASRMAQARSATHAPRCVQPDIDAAIPAFRWASVELLLPVRAIPISFADPLFSPPCHPGYSARVGPEFTGQYTRQRATACASSRCRWHWTWSSNHLLTSPIVPS